MIKNRLKKGKKLFKERYGKEGWNWRRRKKDNMEKVKNR